VGLPAQPAVGEKPQAWEVINPTGVVRKVNFKPSPRLTTLEGKTIVLRWNGKHNGDNFLARLAELFVASYPTAQIVRAWEKDPSMNKISGSQDASRKMAQSLREMGADMVIAAQCD